MLEKPDLKHNEIGSCNIDDVFTSNMGKLISFVYAKEGLDHEYIIFEEAGGSGSCYTPPSTRLLSSNIFISTSPFSLMS